MADSPLCGMCGAPDSWKHSLINCTTSRCTWALVDDELTSQLVNTNETKAKQWLFTLIDSLSHDQFIMVAVTLLAIWTARRKTIHEHIFQTPRATHLFVRSFIQELSVLSENGAITITGGAARGCTYSQATRQKAPPMGYENIHVDVGVRAGRGGSAAALCRFHNGAYL